MLEWSMDGILILDKDFSDTFLSLLMMFLRFDSYSLLILVRIGFYYLNLKMALSIL